MTHSFPTRRSSDLHRVAQPLVGGIAEEAEGVHPGDQPRRQDVRPPGQSVPAVETVDPAGDQIARRSEEHTSELQSLMRISYAVFFLKQKNKKLSSYNHQFVPPTILFIILHI